MWGGAIPDPARCRAYVISCFDSRIGSFTPEPGTGTTTCGITASGLMAVGELGIATPEIVDATIAYFGREADEFEEVRIAIAGLEAVKAKSPDFPKWKALINAQRKADGTWGSDGSRARMTGSSVAALLRMGIEIEDRDAVLAAMREGQRPDGGWSKDGNASDLETTYRVMRALFMMNEKPNLPMLRTYLSAHRQEDGLYSSSSGKNDGGGTYFVTTVNRWARILHSEPAIVETAGFKPLFDGKTLEGWEGDTSLWTVKDSMLVGTSPGLKENNFLATTKSYDDFILKFSFRMTGDPNANSGVQFRSTRVPGHEMSGYQADIGQGYWGCLYDESRRNKVLVQASEKAQAAVNHDGWNHYVLRCMGKHITLTLNGLTSVDYDEKDQSIPNNGKIAVQIHAGGPMQIEFKDMYIQELPIPRPEEKHLSGFHLRTLKPEGRKYSIFLPNDYDSNKAYPAVLFLHGSGERGEDGILPTQAGLGPIIAADPARFPMIVIFPQAKKTWATNSEDTSAALNTLEAVARDHKIDPDRIILTGLSMGGMGSWGLAARMPEKFAAVVPVCGFGDAGWAKSLKGLPVWTFVGDADSEPIVTGTRTLVEAVTANGGAPRWTVYRGVGHNSWDRAYSDPDLQKWMLAQHK